MKIFLTHKFIIKWNGISAYTLLILIISGRLSTMALPSTTISSSKSHLLTSLSTSSSNTYQIPSTIKWKMENYPNPQVEPERCQRRNRSSFVCDPDGIINKLEADKLDALIQDVCNITCVCQTDVMTSCQGYVISIAILDRMAAYNISAQKQLETWTKYLQTTKWGFGKCNNDVIIILAKEEGKFFTATGSSSRTILNNACVNIIMQGAKHNFIQGNFSAGLTDLVSKYSYVLKGGDCIWLKHYRGTGLGPGGIAGVVLAVVAITALMIIFCFCCRRRLRRPRTDSSSSRVPQFLVAMHQGMNDGPYGDRTEPYKDQRCNGGPDRKDTLAIADYDNDG